MAKKNAEIIRKKERTVECERNRERNLIKFGNVNGGCIYCGRKGVRLTKDHYLPKSKVGVIKDNIVKACIECNQAKGSMLPLDFVIKRIDNGTTDN